MGVFDMFIPSEKIECPKCHETLKDPELQSKALDCTLSKYKQGERLLLESEDKKFYIGTGWIEAHSSCSNCNAYIQFKLIIEDGIWIRTDPWN